MKLAIELNDSEAGRIREEAGRLGVTPEALARAALSDLLARDDDDFAQVARLVIDKNRELYRRLA